MPPKRRIQTATSVRSKVTTGSNANAPKPTISINTINNDSTGGTSSRQSPNITNSSRQNQRSPFSAAVAATGSGPTSAQHQTHNNNAVQLSESEWLSINNSSGPNHAMSSGGSGVGNGYEFNSISNHIGSNNNNNNNIIMSDVSCIKHDNANVLPVIPSSTPRDRDTPTQFCALTLAPTQKQDLQNLVNSQIQEIQLEHQRSLNASSSNSTSPRLLYSSSPSPGVQVVNNTNNNNSSNNHTNTLNLTTIECLPLAEDMSELTTVAEKTTVSDLNHHHRSPYHHHGNTSHSHHLSSTAAAGDKTAGMDDNIPNNNNVSTSALKYRHHHEVGTTILEEMSDNELAAYLDEVMRITHKRGLGSGTSGGGGVVSGSGAAVSGNGSGQQGYSTYKSTPSATPPPPLSMPVLSHSPLPLQQQHSQSPQYQHHNTQSILQQHVQSPTQLQEQQHHQQMASNRNNIQSYMNLNTANTLSNSGASGGNNNNDGVGNNNNNHSMNNRNRFRSKSTGSDPNLSTNSNSYPPVNTYYALPMPTTTNAAANKSMNKQPSHQQSITASGGLAVNTSIRNSTNNLFYKSSSSSSTVHQQQATKTTNKISSSSGKLNISATADPITTTTATTGSGKKKNNSSKDVSQEMWTKMTALISPHTSASSGTTTQSSHSSSSHSSSQPPLQYTQNQQYMYNNNNNDTELDCGEDPELMFNNLSMTVIGSAGSGNYGRESPSVTHVVGLSCSGTTLRSATPNPLYSSHYPGTSITANTTGAVGRGNSSPSVNASGGRLHPCDKMFDHRLPPTVVANSSGNASGVNVYNMSSGSVGDVVGIKNTIFTNLSPPTLVSDNMSFLHRLSPLNTAAAGNAGGAAAVTSSSSGGSTPHCRSATTGSATGAGSGTTSARNKTQSQQQPSPTTTSHSKQQQQRQSPTINSHSPVNHHHSTTAHNNNTGGGGGSSNYVRPQCTKKVPENFFNYIIASDTHSAYSNNNNNSNNNINLKVGINNAGGNNNTTNNYQNCDPSTTAKSNSDNNTFNHTTTHTASSNSSVGSSNSNNNSIYSNSNSTSALSLLSQGVMTSPHSAFAFKGTAVTTTGTSATPVNNIGTAVPVVFSLRAKTTNSIAKS